MTSSSAKRPTVAVVGAGPAGLMAAEVIANAGHAVTIYERMPSPARKFLLAGRGGLNLTHSEPIDRFLTRYGATAAAVQNAVTAFPPERTISWAQDLGQETFTGSSGRVFPRAMKASPLLRAWLKRLDVLSVQLKNRHTWAGFAQGGGITIVSDDGTRLTTMPDAVILAVGGGSWPRLGSDGAWVPMLQVAGVGIAPLVPANSGALITWSSVFAARFAGAPLKRIALTVGTTSRRGEAVVTRVGLEGGAIYALGSAIRSALRTDGTAILTVDLKPDMTAAALTQRLSRSQGSQSRSNFLRKVAGLDTVAISLLREPGPLPADPEDMAGLIKALPLTVHGVAGLDRAISTAGGVRLAELTPDFMLLARPGVFVAGEMLDWEAPTGGYLLQAAFATGHAAAMGALRWLAEGVS